MATSVTSAGLKAAADKVILASRGVVEALKFFSTDFSVDVAKPGSAVAVEVLNAVAGDFGAQNGYTVSTNTIKPATVTLSQHKKSTYQISDIDALQNDLAPVWSHLAPTAGKAVAAAAVADAIALLTYGNAKAQITQTLSALGDFATVRAGVVAQSLDPADCALILTPAAYATLLTMLPVNVLGSDEALRRAELGSFLGFKAVIESPSAAVASSASANLGWGFVVPTGALAVACRVVAPVKAGGNLIEFGTIQDEETGFAFGQRVVVNADQGNCNWTVDALYGATLTYHATNCPNAPRYLQLVSTAPSTPAGS